MLVSEWRATVNAMAVHVGGTVRSTGHPNITRSNSPKWKKARSLPWTVDSFLKIYMLMALLENGLSIKIIQQDFVLMIKVPASAIHIPVFPTWIIHETCQVWGRQAVGRVFGRGCVSTAGLHIPGTNPRWPLAFRSAMPHTECPVRSHWNKRTLTRCTVHLSALPPLPTPAPVASAVPGSRPVTGRGFISLPRTASTLYLSKILHGFCHLENGLPLSPRSVQGTPLPQAPTA